MSTTRHTDTVEVILKDQRRRRWSPAEKAALVRRTYEPGMSVSLVARQEGVAASLLFQWRKLDRQGALTAVSAGEAVVPASELAAARAEIAKLMVHPRARGRGLAKRLMATAEQAARDLGRRLLVLDTVEGGVADGLYRRLGWTEAGRIPDFAL